MLSGDFDLIMKNLEIKNLKTNFCLIYLFFYFLIALAFHLIFAQPFNDDFFFQEKAASATLFDFLKERYSTWTSRLLIETVLFLLFRINLIFWKFFDSLILTGIIYYIIKLSIPEQNKNLAFTAILYFLLVPLKMFNSAGWVTTTLTYTWPFFTFMPFLLISKKIIERRKVNSAFKIVSILLLFFAVNKEEILALCIGFSIFLFIVYGHKGKIEKKDIAFFTAALLISLLSLVFIITCPGNKERTIVSIREYFPEWKNISFFQKCHMGFLSIFSYFLGIREINFLLVPLLCVMTFKAYKKHEKKDFIITIVLNIFILICYELKFLSIIAHRFQISFLDFSLFQNKFIAGMGDFSSIEIAVETIIFAIVALALITEIYRLSKNRESGIFNCITIFGGFCSAFILSFSPTVYASGIRTFFYFTIAIIIITLRLGFEKTKEQKND